MTQVVDVSQVFGPPEGRRAEDGRLYGSTEPRLWTPALRPLNRKTSRGYEAIDFAEQVLGLELLPWERWLLIHALELDPSGGFRFRIILLLVARQNGKTTLWIVLALWRLFLDGARLVIGTAQDLDLARDVWNEAIDLIEASPELKDELADVRRTNGNEYFKVAGGGRYRIKAANRKAGRGPSVDLVGLDELREQRNWDAWGALSKTTMARADGQTWGISNAGDDESVVLNHLRSAAGVHLGPDGVSVLGDPRDRSIGIFEYSAPEGCDLDNRSCWQQANPGLGYVIDEAAIASAAASDPPEVFRTEVLCQKVDALNSAIDLAGWRACKDVQGRFALESRVGWCVDAAPDGKHVALAAGQLTEDGRVKVEVVETWDSVDAARGELQGWIDANEPAQIGWFPGGPAAAMAADLRALTAPESVAKAHAHDAKWRFVRELKGTELLETCQEFGELVDARLLLHADQAVLNGHVHGARRQVQGDGWRFARRGAGPVNAVYAAAGAVHVVRTLPALARPKPRSAVY